MLRLEEVRKKKNMSQVELARAIGISQVSICKFESGEMYPSLETLAKLAVVLDCPLDDLVDVRAIASAS